MRVQTFARTRLSRARSRLCVNCAHTLRSLERTQQRTPILPPPPHTATPHRHHHRKCTFHPGCRATAAQQSIPHPRHTLRNMPRSVRMAWAVCVCSNFHCILIYVRRQGALLAQRAERDATSKRYEEHAARCAPNTDQRKPRQYRKRARSQSQSSSVATRNTHQNKPKTGARKRPTTTLTDIALRKRARHEFSLTSRFVDCFLAWNRIDNDISSQADLV